MVRRPPVALVANGRMFPFLYALFYGTFSPDDTSELGMFLRPACESTFMISVRYFTFDDRVLHPKHLAKKSKQPFQNLQVLPAAPGKVYPPDQVRSVRSQGF